MKEPVYKYSDITERIIRCAINVHKTLGNGFQEVIYQRAMEIEIQESGLAYGRECEMPIYYKDHEIGVRRVDFFVEGKIMVELKALIKLEDVHAAQTINYLEAFKLEIGLLLNFGSKSLQIKRFTNERKLMRK